MKLDVQKRIAASVLKVSKKRVWFDEQKLTEIKEAITKQDISSLINQGVIGARPKRGVSRGRARKILIQKRKGRRKGHGSREGKANARLSTKLQWINKIRLQRSFLKELKDKRLLEPKTYRMLYMRAKGGYFRSRRHLKIYMQDHNLFFKKQDKK